MKKLLLLLLLQFTIAARAQLIQLPIFYQSNYLRVVQPNSSQKLDTLMNPYTGGMNCPTFFNIDMDGDGIPDLFVFDRDKDENQFLNFIAYAKNSTKYRFTPYYESAFPSDMNSWAGFYDYNKDGLMDLFTHTQPYINSTGVKTYKNTSYIDPISKKYKLHFTAFSDTLFNYNALGHPTQVNIPYVANPCFVDVDKDGYMDILTYEQDLTSIYWYRNEGKKGPGGSYKDSLRFFLSDQCWAKYREDGPHFYNAFPCNEYLVYDPIKHKQNNAHFNTSIAVFDVDGDGDLDILVGDGGNDTLTMLLNGKTKNKNGRDTAINLPNTKNNNYPFSENAIIHALPTPSFTDVNNDGVTDLIVAAGQPSEKDSVNVSHQNNIWYYQNHGDTIAPAFTTPVKDFLQNTTVDWGVNSAPCFIDVDKDGRKDLIVAVKDGAGPTGNNSHLILYLNKAGVKPGSKPYLLYQTDDYLNFSKLSPSIRRPVPSGYLNGKDNKTDLIVGNDSGKVMYFKDRSAGLSPANYVLAQSSLKYLVSGKLTTIDVGNNSAPTSADINNDGKTDLLIGANDGRISYYRCLGYGPAPDYIPYFELVTKTFGGINATPLSDLESAPCIADFNKNGKPDLLVGDYFGQLFYYPDFDTVGTLTPASANLVYDYRTGQRYTNKLFSGELKPAVANLDQDSIPDIMLGCRRGGLFFLGTNKSDSFETIGNSGIEETNVPIPPEILLYPNPAKDYIVIQYSHNTSVMDATIKITDILGRSQISHPFTMIPGKGSELVYTSNLPNGLYIVNLIDGDQILRSSKFIIHK